MASATKRLTRLLLESVAPLLIVVVGFLLYRPALDLMLFWDDIPHMLWLDTHLGGEYWLSSSGFPFYRPAAFTTWEILGHNATALHTLSVGLHLVNAVLVYALANRLSHSRQAGFFAGLLFVTFPFSYQTVIPTPAQFHLWLTFGFLASAYLILAWLDHPRHWKLILAWVVAFWAIFSHENGIVAPVLIGLIVLTAHPDLLPIRHADFQFSRLRQNRFLIALAPIAFFALLYGLIWQIIPLDNDSTGLKTAALDVKIGQTLQAIGFPLAALFRMFIDPQSGTLLAWVSGCVALTIFGLWFYMQQRWPVHDGDDDSLSPAPVEPTRLVGLGLLWIPLAMLPAWLFLDVAYLLSNPRLHYLASVGVAWAWAGLLTTPLPRLAPRLLQPIVGVTGIAIALMIALPFIQNRLDEHHRLNDYYQEIANTAAVENQSLLVVNPPAYLAPRKPTFLLGAEGSVYLPDFVSLTDFLRLNDGDFPPSAIEHVARADDLIPATTRIYQVEAAGLDRATLSTYDRVLVSRQIGGDIFAPLAGIHLENAPIPTTPAADFGNGIILESLQIGPDEILSEATDKKILRLELVWQVQSPPTELLEIFVHLMCDDRLAADADGPPVGRLYPLAMWQPGERWQDFRYFIIPDGLYPPECLSVLVGLYNPTTGDRLPVTATISIN
ncbi:MAG: hypothetical protein DPW16_08455 [Chloroflexi bacterium]|nr:hypothetical protein [Chloroflexota bacterium]